ncbi:MAG: sugar nucleotide-binding protein [Candidatus Omnitrophica bacterium]|nr:sugar nucleotide-binding protein [Candidatus Omnitrophota bacterium]
MSSKILILGKGFIGSRLHKEIDSDLFESPISTLTDAERIISRFNPKIIINCIGYTGRNVDECELEKDKALLANTFVPIILGEACLRHNIKLVHISSGCIYNYDYSKDKPVKEDREPDFLGLYYSRTKIYAEKALEVILRKFPVLIARIRIPLDNRAHPKNLLAKLINYKKVIDIPNSVTYIPDFIKALKHLLKIDANGIYNVVNKGVLKYPELMEVYKRYVPDFEYEKINFRKLNLVRTNLILSTKKLERTGFKVRDIHAVLDECVRGYLER